MPPPYIRAITVAVKNFDYWKNAPLDNSLQLLLLTRLLIQSNRVGARTRILCAGAGAGLEGREGGELCIVPRERSRVAIRYGVPCTGVCRRWI